MRNCNRYKDKLIHTECDRKRLEWIEAEELHALEKRKKSMRHYQRFFGKSDL